MDYVAASRLRTVHDSEHTNRQLSWIGVGALLLLRFGQLAFAGKMFTSQTQSLSALVETGTYAVTVALIWLERERLAECNMDGLAVALIMTTEPVKTLLLPFMGLSSLPMAFPHFASLVVLACSLVLLILLLRNSRKGLRITRKSLLWWLIGAACGILVAALVACPCSIQFRAGRHFGFDPWGMLKNAVIMAFPYRTVAPIASEEPLFRGFLWGQLRRLGIGERWTWLLVAFFFIVAHLHYLPSYPITFFVVVPVASLALGLIAWKSRTLSSSMGLHSMVNLFGSTFVYLAAQAWG